jgi:tetratricopeptide (TPR) repeat protein
MLSLPNDGRYPTLDFTPQQRRRRTLEALTSRLAGLAGQNPVLIIFEDAHWIDPSSLEALGQTVLRIKTLPVLLIVTFRPDFDPPWAGNSHVTRLTLRRLRERESAGIVVHLLGGKKVPADVITEILERTDGIPLFVEEMTKAVLEAESDRPAQTTVAVAPLPRLALPASLHASLMARLDRLGTPAKEVAQIGAAIGREFSHALLTAVVPRLDLESALDRLIAAGLLFRQGTPPHANYLFKHALVQDAAYGTLLRQLRRALRIVEIFENQFADIAESQPELVARHCTEAGLIEKAASLWGKAGQRSLARSALIEAEAQLIRALDQMGDLPGTSKLRSEQIKLQIALANTLMHTKGYSSPETKASLDQARLYMQQSEALGEHPEDPLVLFSGLYGSWAAHFVAFHGNEMREVAAQFLDLAEKHKGTVPLMIGHRLMGTSLLFTGNIIAARAHLNQAKSLYDASEHRPLATRFGQDIEAVILSNRSLTLWLLGYPEAARGDAEHAVAHAREIGQATTLMYVLSLTLIIHAYCGNHTLANAQADELVALAHDKGAVYWNALGRMKQGFLFGKTGKFSEAVQMLTSGIAAHRSTGSTLGIPQHLWYLAMAYADLGRIEEAWQSISEAIAAMEASKETWCEPEVHRTAGEITLLSSDTDTATAEGYFRQALAMSRARH